MEPVASSTASGQGRRQNPSRSKRGGPGVGTCDVDLMILESYKRKLETEPLIPEDTPFILTTNSSKFSGSSSSNGESTININTVANDRYFDRPEVLKAFREQEIIQTPEFWAISESSSVGGRFRPRGAEDESAETSDAAYEKRHKKFETFEKRQRLREKEKLKHEHYKLKERIDQLRATDSSAFMSVPATAFWTLPQPEKVNTDAENSDTASGAQANATAEQIEGERRKKEMLDHAISLEKRYSYLLPSERARKTQDLSTVDKVPDEDESETEKTPQAGPSRKEAESIKFRLPARSSLSTTPASSPAATKPPRKPKGNAKLPLSSRSVHNNLSTSVPPQEQTSSVSSPIIDVEMQTPEAERPASPPPPPTTLSPLAATPEIPVSATRATSAKLTSTRQTNGRTRTQKDAHVQQTLGAGAELQATAKVPTRKNARARPVSVQIADDGESEKAPSDEEIVPTEDAEEVSEEVSTKIEGNQDEPEPSSDAQMLGPGEVSPGVRESVTRLQQTGSAAVSASNGHEPLPENLSHEHLPPTDRASMISPEPEESISARPTKRQRKISVKARALSIAQSTTHSQNQHTPSVPPSPPPISTRTHRKSGPRGQQSQVYISSTTGKEVRTTSFLLMAAIRNEGAKRNVEKRHNTSFGIPTPGFKDLHDFEIPEWMHYPEDEEPFIPLPDIDYAQIEPQPQPTDATEHDAHVDTEHIESGAELDGQVPSTVSENGISKEFEPKELIQSTSPQLEPAQATQAENVDETQDEPMETEPTEPEHEESPHPTEPESEPGVGIRVLSRSRGDEDEEELEW